MHFLDKPGLFAICGRLRAGMIVPPPLNGERSTSRGNAYQVGRRSSDHYSNVKIGVHVKIGVSPDVDMVESNGHWIPCRARGYIVPARGEPDGSE